MLKIGLKLMHFFTRSELSNPAFLETTLLVSINLTADCGDDHEAEDESDDEPYFTDWRRILLDDSSVVLEDLPDHGSPEDEN